MKTGSEQFTLPGPIYCRWRGSPRNGTLLIGTELLPLMGPDCVAPLQWPVLIEFRINSGETTCHERDSGGFPLPPDHFASHVGYGTSMLVDVGDPTPVRRVSIEMGE
jgi:hypothetical protein